MVKVTMERPGAGLHPNLARIAAAYDMILEELSTSRITVSQARARIAQLEARDDAGVRWSIDPDSGRWIRTTVSGMQEYDTPPSFGFQTHDAFSYTTERSNAARGPANPNERVEMYEAADQRLTADGAVLPEGAFRNDVRAGEQHGVRWTRAQLLMLVAVLMVLVAAAFIVLR